ncbi:class III lanthionine synthetase LanKC N-terminal domain-containing protein [Actinokineospora bangkokensis]|uniref:Protein kinase domain-containing protein n=1 Tax=Actinokineospora bangkokensis TaxID=1193682 RepID=A0A1Q9LMC8_9PSEU|nr:lanthionine synthetase LanC family protein [Actinokineospora bangkokensis]OLR93192.1 hypothetical protein BJP25_16985 [Actinokineospora bangkokensis]
MTVPVLDPVSQVAHRLAAEWSRTHRVRPDGGWWHFEPTGGGPLAQQGWKLHVSTVPTTAAEALRRVAPILLRRGVRWKSARTVEHLARLCSPPSPVSQAGKFVTAYLEDSADVADLAEELHSATRDLPGPAVPSDRRYRRGSNVHLRYGAFVGKITYAGPDQVRSLVVLSPDGTAVPDSRKPGGYRPEWVPDPLPPVAAPAPPVGTGLFGRGVRISGLVQRSVKGGVFRGELAGRPVVVKEGRSGTCADVLGRDAVDRLRNEWRLLRHLRGTGLAPEPLDFFVEDDNAYLVAEFLPGVTLRRFVERANYTGGVAAADLRVLCREVAALADGLRAHGVEPRDFTPNNIMVDDGRLTAIDLELCAFAESPEPLFEGCTPGYGKPGRDSDPDFAVAATTHFVLTGVDPFVGIGHDPAPHVDAMLTAFAPAGVEVEADLVRDRIGAPPGTTRCDTDQVVEDAVTAGEELVDRAEWDRGAWPWPSAWASEAFHPACFHTGTTGVAQFYLDLFRATGDRRWVRHAADLLDRVVSGTPFVPGTTPPGLHFGVGALPWLLADLSTLVDGRRAPLLRARSHALADALVAHDPGAWDITHGWAGIGLAQLGTLLATGDLDRRGHVLGVVERLLDGAQDRSGLPVWLKGSDHSYGYAHGSAGIGYFLLVAGTALGHDAAVGTAVRAARALVALAEPTALGHSWRGGPDPGSALWTHWCNGAAGVGAFLLATGRATGDDDLVEAARGAGRAITGGRAFGSANRCHGLAGDGDFLLDLAEPEFLDGAERVGRKLDALRVRSGRGHAWAHEGGSAPRPSYMRGHLGVHAFRLRLAGLLPHAPLTIPGSTP